jgi:hypothetical protein
MLIEATVRPIQYRLKNGNEVILHPGVPVDLPDCTAQYLLQQAREKVRIIENEPVTIEPAMKPNGGPLSPIYWQTGTGEILGPAIPEFHAKSGHQFWIVTTFKENIRSINADRLRSKKAFETQRAVHEIQLIWEF